MAAPKKSKKIIRYRKPLNLNVGMFIFALIFIYMIFSVYTYMRRDKVHFYEVQEGSIVSNSNFTGIILREEEIRTTDRAGYINYYIREGKRAGVGARIYSIDETGSMSSVLESSTDGNIQLSNENLTDLKKQLTAFSIGYQDENFSTVYHTKYELEASVLEYVNFNTMNNLDNLLDQAGINFEQVRSDQAGIISYGIDSYETLSIADISADIFNKSDYVKSITKAGKLIESNVPVYKVITSDKWSVIFPLSEHDVEKYGQAKRLDVQFTKTDLTSSGDFSMITGKDGNLYGRLDFNKYMVQFVSDRFINFEIIPEKADGLKIPVTSVTSKQFYLIPIDYLTKGGDSSDSGFYKEVYSESGSTVVFIPAEIYASNDEYYYIEGGSGLTPGDYVIKPDSVDRYQIGPQDSLQGVYNINKGYAVFKQIEVLASNDEYYTIKKNMAYGLSVYDHIVLNASTVSEGELIYQ